MIRYLLILLYLLAVSEATFGLILGFGTGLSAKNILLYALVFSILMRGVLSSTKIYVPLFAIHLSFLALLGYAALSWIINTLFVPTYPSLHGLITLKSQLIDNYLFFLVFFFGPSDYKEARSIFLFALNLIGIMTVMTILDVSNLIDLGLMEQDADGRVRGPIGQSNQYGAFMAFFVPVFAAMALGSAGVARLTWGFVFLCGFGLLVATGSRGALAGFVSGSLIGTYFIRRYFDRKKMRRTAGKILAASVVIAIAVGFTNLDLAMERIEQSTSTDVQELTSGRSAIWRATLMVQAERPFSFLIGNGWNAHENSGIWKSAHSSYLKILFELGIIGLAFYLMLLINVVSQTQILIKRTYDKERILMCGIAFGLFSVIIATLFVELQTPWFYIWSFLGMSLRIAYEKDCEFLSKTMHHSNDFP